MGTDVDLVITYDKPFYHPGSQVNGSIFLYVRSPCQISNLTMDIKGLERTKATRHWTTTRTSGVGKNRRTRTYHHYSTCKHERSIYNYSFPVYQSNSTILQIGQYQYPFSFTFPTYLANSFSKEFVDQHRRNSYAYIEYKIECTLIFAYNSPPKTSEIVLEIVQDTKGIDSDLNNETSILIEQDIKCYCCFPCGQVKGKVSFEKMEYQTGDIATINVDLDNVNGPDIGDLRAVLKQYVSVKALLGHSNKIDRVVSVNPENIGGSDQSKMKKKEAGQRTFKIQIPKTLDNMVKTFNVTCDYSLEFTAITDFFCKCYMYDKDPSAFVPVNIFRFHGDGGMVQHQQLEQ